MLLFLETVNILAILLMLFMLAVILKQQPSKVQTAFLLYDVFTMIFVMGLHLELLRSDTLGEALSGLCVQYAGQAGLLMSLLWFVSEFASFYIPVWVYGLQAVCNVLVLAGVFTAEKHCFFYKSMEIVTDGLYHRIQVDGGILWRLHFVHLYAVVFMVLFLCAARYRAGTPVQKKRIAYIATGFGVLGAMLILKIAGLFGSYNPIVIAMAFCMFCMLMAVVRYSYFGSLHAAVDNAFNHGNEGLIILDSGDTVIFTNQRMGRLFPDIRRGSKIDRYPEIRKLMEGGEHLLYREDAVYELRVEEIIEHGEQNGRMLWFVDQTQSLRTMQKLREADEAKTQFLINVSHELRTPMNTMLGMHEMILRESGEEAILSYAKEAAIAGEHMLSLIREILDASRLESGALTLSNRPYRIKEELKRAEELIRPQAQSKGVAFLVNVDDELEAESGLGIGDPVRVRQILVNLLSNAVKYTDSGYVRLEADLWRADGDRRLKLSVRDSGVGVKKDEQKQIFESFGRGSNAGGRDGIGLGLAIARQLAMAMGGTLTVESAEGEGSVFTVFLPWPEAKGEETAAGNENGQTDIKLPVSQEKEPAVDFCGKTMLAVDDNERNLLVLRHLLKRTNAVIETVADGAAAVEACRHKKFDLILLDHRMPGMDGMRALQVIRQDPQGKNRDTKAVALTANAGKEAEQEYLEKGFAGYLPKPIEPKRLEQMLRYHLTAGNTKEYVQREGVKTDVADEGRWLKQLEQNGICTRDGLNYADGDAAFYWELLEVFSRQQSKNRQNLEELLDKIERQPDMPAGETERIPDGEVWNAWVVVCHGLKGEARGIGAVSLGEYFSQMELAGRRKDRRKIGEIYPFAVREWEQTAESIRLTKKEMSL